MTNLNIPDSPEEFDKQAGRPGALLEMLKPTNTLRRKARNLVMDRQDHVYAETVPVTGYAIVSQVAGSSHDIRTKLKLNGYTWIGHDELYEGNEGSLLAEIAECLDFPVFYTLEAQAFTVWTKQLVSDIVEEGLCGQESDEATRERALDLETVRSGMMFGTHRYATNYKVS